MGSNERQKNSFDKSILEHLYPQEHWAKQYFTTNNIPLSVVSKHLNVGYNYACNILSGTTRITPENEAKIKELVGLLEAEGKNGCEE